MKKAMTLTYEVGEALYLNVTNQCPCACAFCIRRNDDGAYGSDPLWLEHEPDMAEMQAALAGRDLAGYPELVVCGYGEPTMRLEFICELAAYIKGICPKAVLRLNTNGLAALYVDEKAAEKLSAVYDKISVSLNAGTPEVYKEVTRPRDDPENAFGAMLQFAADCKALGAEVLFTAVDVITPEEIAKAQKIADAMGIPLRVREYIQ